MPAPVVFVHDLRGAPTDWAADLAVALPRRLTVESAVDAVRVALLELDEPAVLVGNGVGGHLAVAAARTSSVVGVIAVGCGTEPLGWLLDSYRIASAASGLHKDGGAAVASWAAETYGSEGAEFDAALEQLARLDVRANLRAIDAPVRLVNGARDGYRMQERSFLRATRDGRLVRVPGSTERMRNPALDETLPTVIAAL